MASIMQQFVNTFLPRELASLRDKMSEYYSVDEKVKRTRRIKYDDGADETDNLVDPGASSTDEATSKPQTIYISDSEDDEPLQVRLQSKQEKKKPNSRAQKVLSSPLRFKCSNCSAGFRNKKNFKNHQKECLTEKVGSENICLVREGSPRKPTLFRPHLDRSPIPSSYLSPSRTGGYEDSMDGSDFDTPSRRSGRSRAPVSYEEPLLDIDVSAETSPDESLGSDNPKKYVLSGLARRNQPSTSESRSKTSLGSSVSLQRPPRRRSVIPSSPSVKEHFRETKRRSRSRLSVRAVDETVEMKDISCCTEPLLCTQEPLQACPSRDKYGKFFSVGGIEETPSGALKIKLNRVEKRKSIDSKPDRKENLYETPPSAVSYFMPRVSRSIAKDIGISPQKLAKLLADSPKVDLF